MKRWMIRLLTMLLVFGMLLPASAALADDNYDSGIINADKVAFRNGPSTESSRIRRLREGSVVDVLETNVQAEWHKIRFNGETGYVNQRYVTLLPGIGSAGYQGTVVNVKESVNVRGTASKHGDLLGTAALGTIYPVSKTGGLDGWYEIDYNGKTGYILDDYLQLSGRASYGQLSSLTVSGGTLLSAFSPDTYGYVVRADSGEVRISATGAAGAKVQIGESKSDSTVISMPKTGTKTVRISVGGKVKYSIYIVRNVLTVGTWNIKRGNGHLTGMTQLLQAQQPDLMGIQEVYRSPAKGKTEKIDNLLSIRTRSHGEMQFDPTVTYGGGGEYGLGMLSRYDIESSEKVKLYSGEGEQRILQKIVVKIDGKRVSVYNTHFSYHSAAIRANQFATVKKVMDADRNDYKILFGDFNAKAAEFSVFGDDYTVLNAADTKFYGYDGTLIQKLDIDNIIVSDNITVLNSRMIDTDLSDHMPIFAYLKLD